MTKYDYIPTEFGRNWVSSRHEARRGVHTPLAYIDINEGNRYDADVFAQIMYWHEPSTETGKPRLTHEEGGYLWLAKNHADWFRETRIKQQTVRKCLERLKKRCLIFYEPHGSDGKVTPFMRINWAEFERRIKLWLSHNMADIREREYYETIKIFDAPPVISEQGGAVIREQGGLLSENTPLLPENDSNTETTAETTSEIKDSGNTVPRTNHKDSASDDASVPVSAVTDVAQKAKAESTTPPPRADISSFDLIPGDQYTEPLRKPYTCTETDIAEMIAAWWEWVPVKPGIRGRPSKLADHMKIPTNREYARNLFVRGVRPIDFVRCLVAIQYNQDEDDRPHKLAGKEMPFQYVCPIVDQWVADHRADDLGLYTTQEPRFAARKRGLHYTLGEDIYARAKEFFIDIPPPYIPIDVMNDPQTDETLSTPDETDYGQWTPSDWEKAGMPL